MPYKYSEYIDKIERCPPTHYHQQEIVVFRWVHENMAHPNDFLPVALINPKRVNDPTIDSQGKCKGYGLSFYDTAANARQQYNGRIAANPPLVKQIGEYVAEGQLSQGDGIVSPVDKRTGHLTFYEYASVDLKSKFAIVGRADSYG